MPATAAFESTFLSSAPDLRVAKPARSAPVNKLEAFSSLALFHGADDVDLRRLSESALLRTFARGRTIVRGCSGDCVILVSGRAKTVVARGTSSAELALGIFEDGEIVCDAGWGSRAKEFPGETVSLERSSVLFIPRRPLEAFLERNAGVGLRFIQALAGQWHRVTRMAVENCSLEIGDRLSRRLSELSASRGRTQADGSVRIEHGLLQSELAASIGASREAVNRQLAIWRQQGLIEAGRRFLVVLDPLGLSMSMSADTRRAGAYPEASVRPL
jgi:CRP/FNR family cyclic AMP-dependent transcriptional regulator